METVISGKIEEFVAFFKARFDINGNFILDEKGSIPMSVDTGFNGGIALPFETIDSMGLEFKYFATLELATGEIRDLPVFSGRVFVKDRLIDTFFMPGKYLIGMSFLAATGSVLSFNFNKSEVKLIK